MRDGYNKDWPYQKIILNVVGTKNRLVDRREVSGH